MTAAQGRTAAHVALFGEFHEQRTDRRGRIAASGRTLEEHLDIAAFPQDRSAGQARRYGSISRAAISKAGACGGWPDPIRRSSRARSCAVGTKACRFEIRPGDDISQGRRAELRDWYNAPFDEDTWYGFSTYLPQAFSPPQGVGVVLAQWHDQAELGDPAGKPPLAIRYLDGALRFTGAFAEVASQRSGKALCIPRDRRHVPRGVWLDFVFRIHWSRLGDVRDRRVSGWRKPLFRLRGAARLPQRDQGPVFQVRGLCERRHNRAAGRLSRQLQPCRQSSKPSIRARLA